jgi:hypothetical protein
MPGSKKTKKRFEAARNGHVSQEKGRYEKK